MLEFEFFTTMVSQMLSKIDPEGLAIRPTQDALLDFLAVLRGCFNFGMSAEDTALMVLASETRIA